MDSSWRFLRFFIPCLGFRDTIRPPSKTGEISHGTNVKDLPQHKICEPSTQYISAYCAPEHALDHVHDKIWKSKAKKQPPPEIIKGIKAWKDRRPFAYGTLNSLYESDKETNKKTGDPIADSLAIVTRGNCSILALADGVNWGAKSKLAANCCIYGSVTYIDKNLRKCRTTREVFATILHSFKCAQNLILDLEGTMSTLCVGVVVQLVEKDRWAFCVVNVGDSYAYVYNKDRGIQEVTENSHPIDELRDMRFSGGALGLADGCNPDLDNLTFSCILLDRNDYVFLCSDGVSDNFDPKVMRRLPKPNEKYISKLKTNTSNSDESCMPVSNDEDCCIQNVENSKDLCHNDGSDVKSDVILRNDSTGSSNHDSDFDGKFENVVTYCRENESISSLGSCNIDIDSHSNCDSAFSNSSSVSPERISSFPYHKTNSGFASDYTNSSSNESLSNTIESDELMRKKVNPRIEELKGFGYPSKSSDRNNICKAPLERTISSTSCDRRPSVKTRHYSKSHSMYASCPNLLFGQIDFNVLSGRTRHYGALQNIEEALIDIETPSITDGEIQADEICIRLLTKVFRLTEERREILEEVPQTQIEKLTKKERREYNEEIKRKLKDVPGKLDHVSIVAFSIDGLLAEMARRREKASQKTESDEEDSELISPEMKNEKSTGGFLQNMFRRKSAPVDSSVVSPMVNQNIELSEDYNRQVAKAMMR